MTTFVAALLISASPLVTKHSGSGFAPEGYRFHENCQVFADRIVKDSSDTGVETFPLPIAAEEIAKLIERAASEPVVETDNYLCDAPTTSTSAGPVELFFSGACGSKRIFRKGEAASALRALVDTHCPKTFEYGNRN